MQPIGPDGTLFLQEMQDMLRAGSATSYLSSFPGASWQVPWLCAPSKLSFLPQVYRGISQRHCYPPSWKRWAFFLFPGTSLALVAIAVYTFMETTENYYYTHSIWHILVASSVAFLLPPGDKQKDPWAWSRKLLCHYQICRNDQEELYTVR